MKRISIKNIALFAATALLLNACSGDGFGQIFITDTNREHLDRILGNGSFDYKIFSVENGEVTERSATNVQA